MEPNTAKKSPRIEIADDYVSRLHEYDSGRAAGREMFKAHPIVFKNANNARRAIEQAKDRAYKLANKRPAPPEHISEYAVPEGFKTKGRFTLYNKDGERSATWILEREDAAAQRAIFIGAIEAMAEELPRLSVISPPKGGIESLCNLYTLTDCHLGMMAAASEAGESWGLEKGEETIGKGFDWLISGAPKAKKAVIAELGDFLHSEGLSSVTSRSGHSLDQDCRMGDMVRSSIRLLRKIVDSCLMTHQEVELVIAEGNHDEAASLILRESFKAIYENEPRLKVIEGVNGDLPYYETTHGETMLGFHHGHIKNVKSKGAAQSLALLFANGEAWRTTRRRYIHTGHHHDEAVIEVSGAKCFAHPSMIAPDAYASRNFGGAMRQMTAHTYHDEHGKVGEYTVTPEMLN